MAVLLVAVAGSSFGGEFNGSMIPGESVTVAGHEIALRGVETGEGERFVYVRALFDVDGEQMSPEIRAYEDQEVPVAEPVARVGLIDDVIVAISLIFPDGNTVEVSVFVRPLVSWVWFGASLIGLAGLIALFARGGAAAMRRRSAREVLRSGGTTSGTVSR
jgi:cytochrome c biogenesis factor